MSANIVDMDWNEDEGYTLTLEDGRTVDIQFAIQTNRLHPDYNCYYPKITKTSIQEGKLTIDEQDEIRDYIYSSDEIMSKAAEFNEENLEF